MSESGVSQASHWISVTLSADKKLRKEIMLIKERLNLSKV